MFLNIPFKWLNEASRLMYNLLGKKISQPAGELPYIVMHIDDPRGIISTFSHEGTLYEIVVREKQS